jgi:RHS repeat-associated protein
MEYNLEYAADYYPYGRILREFNPKAEKYLSTHHERDTETGLDYRGARYYDADVARFLSLDPLAADYPTLSAYNYVAANPITYVDPDGKKIATAGGLGFRVRTRINVLLLRVLAPKEVRQKVRQLQQNKDVTVTVNDRASSKSKNPDPINNTPGTRFANNENDDIEIQLQSNEEHKSIVTQGKKSVTIGNSLFVLTNEFQEAISLLNGEDPISRIQNFEKTGTITEMNVLSNKTENKVRKRFLSQERNPTSTKAGSAGSPKAARKLRREINKKRKESLKTKNES